MLEKWELLSSRVDKDYGIFKVRVDSARSPRTNRVNEFYTLESGKWVNVIPLTPEGEVVMIRQYRHGSREMSLEIPGGLVEGEDPWCAALRELVEETGYEGSRVTFLGKVSPNPALFNNLCYTYLVEDARRTQGLNLDEGEDIEVDLIPLARIPSLISEGRINHALVLAAFYFYLNRKP